MLMEYSRLFFLVITSFCLCNMVAKSELIIRDSEAALERSNEFTGFDRRINAQRANAIQSEKLILVDSTTPFLGEYWSRKSVWRVSYFDVVLADTGEKVMNRDFEVYIDSATGNLLKIVCEYDKLDSVSEPYLGALEAEKQLRETEEEYVGFPSDTPKVDFIAALNACPRSPMFAKQILGQYVLLRLGERKPYPVWVVTLVGIPPIEPIGQGGEWIPTYQRSRVRQVVDSRTGKILFTSTIPGIPLKPEDIKELFPGEQ